MCLMYSVPATSIAAGRADTHRTSAHHAAHIRTESEHDEHKVSGIFAAAAAAVPAPAAALPALSIRSSSDGSTVSSTMVELHDNSARIATAPETAESAVSNTATTIPEADQVAYARQSSDDREPVPAAAAIVHSSPPSPPVHTPRIDDARAEVSAAAVTEEVGTANRGTSTADTVPEASEQSPATGGSDDAAYESKVGALVDLHRVWPQTVGHDLANSLVSTDHSVPFNHFPVCPYRSAPRR